MWRGIFSGQEVGLSIDEVQKFCDDIGLSGENVGLYCIVVGLSRSDVGPSGDVWELRLTA